MYKSFIDYIPEIQSILTEHNLSIENIDNTMYLIKHNNYCFKIYDKAGHGYLFNWSIQRRPNKEYYSKDEYVDFWVYKYLNKGIKINTNFNRNIEEYNKQLIMFNEFFEEIITNIEKKGDNFWIEMDTLFKNQIDRVAQYKSDN